MSLAEELRKQLQTGTYYSMGRFMDRQGDAILAALEALEPMTLMRERIKGRTPPYAGDGGQGTRKEPRTGIASRRIELFYRRKVADAQEQRGAAAPEERPVNEPKKVQIAPHPAELCEAPAIGGPCTLPAGHNMGRLDIPQNHKHESAPHPLPDRIDALLSGVPTADGERKISLADVLNWEIDAIALLREAAKELRR